MGTPAQTPLINSPNANNKLLVKNCRELLPDQSQWTHEEKLQKTAEDKKHAKTAADYTAYFTKMVQPLNELAKDLSLADVTFVMAQSALESGWLNIENAWLNNPFGMTAGGKDNLGFNTIQQAISYWKCLFGDKVRGAKSMDDYMGKLKGYNTVNKDYYNSGFWGSMMATVEKKAKENQYIKTPDGSTLIFERR